MFDRSCVSRLAFHLHFVLGLACEALLGRPHSSQRLLVTPQFRNDVKLVHQFPALALWFVADVTVLLIGMLFRSNLEFVAEV